ncbi:hypothetical protein CKO40_12355 [Halochromatium glycolicum]|uniref:Uncharacterized protein n=1 Tax=Halochromatium glycolicum TaxID=85075 RepID=A0AAJ0U4W2_9GAMM|nr:hypothetical protein [Halochromatium glycolicum]
MMPVSSGVGRVSAAWGVDRPDGDRQAPMDGFTASPSSGHPAGAAAVQLAPQRFSRRRGGSAGAPAVQPAPRRFNWRYGS